MSRPHLAKVLAGALGLVVAFGLPPRASGQADASRDDAFADEAARSVVRRAREARAAGVADIRSYEAVLRERIYLGMTAPRFRRERPLFEQERVARLRWTDQGERAILWIGARRAIPVVGADTRLEEGERPPVGPVEEGDLATRLREELPVELLTDADLPAFAFRPGGGERLSLGDDWALHPLADTAAAQYRYRSGDTLHVALPDRELTLFEIRVEPRRSDFHLVAGSLWFDAETGALARATYRPARDFELGLDDPEAADEIPGFVEPVEADIRLVTVEYALDELRHWLPRRFALEGEASLAGAVRIPITLEWEVRDHEVNGTTEIPVEGALPEGWSRRTRPVDEEDGSTGSLTSIVPTADSLLSAAALSARLGPRRPAGFSAAEMRRLRDDLQSLLPAYRRYYPDFSWGLGAGLVRFNRVEGLSAGVAAEVPLSPRTVLALGARIGTGDGEPYGSLGIVHGPRDRSWEATVYRRLESMNDWDQPFSLPASLTNLVLGSDRGEYVRTAGLSGGYRASGRSYLWRAEAFVERHRPAARETGFYLLEGLKGDTVDAVLPADPVELYGVRTHLEWHRGLHPGETIVTAALHGEVARGEASYQRVYSGLTARAPMGRAVTGGVELAAGVAWGADIPAQRYFFFGGARLMRGFNTNELREESFWRGRVEVGPAFPGLRLVLFADAGWVGPGAAFGREAFDTDRWLTSAGAGLSFLDGLIRLDAARAFQGAERWKAHFYLDGLL